jgi:transposase
MDETVDLDEASTAIRVDIGAIFVSMELSRSKWLLTSLLPGGGEKMSQHSLPAGDLHGLFERFAEYRRKARGRMGRDYPIVVIQEAGLDGFWIHRALEREGIESHVVDPASIAVPRKKRRAKTDRIDGQALLRVLMAFKRGEPRVCAMVRPPSPQDEDRRRIGRERDTLIKERTGHINRIKGLMFTQGVLDYEPMARDRRARLESLRTGLGDPLASHLKTLIGRELDRLELLIEQIAAVERERAELLDPQGSPETAKAAKLVEFKGIGAEFAAKLWLEAFYRSFGNRRQLGGFSGLAPSPWSSGQIHHEQGVSKAGNPRLRAVLIELAWLWVRHQPDSALTQWFLRRLKDNGGRFKKTLIVALARKLFVALWKYLEKGEPMKGAVMKSTPPKSAGRKSPAPKAPSPRSAA